MNAESQYQCELLELIARHLGIRAIPARPEVAAPSTFEQREELLRDLLQKIQAQFKLPVDVDCQTIQTQMQRSEP